MSLDYDLRDVPIEIRTELSEGGELVMSNVTYEIIWGCLTTRIGVINESNWAEWWSRYRLWNKAFGHESKVTEQDVYNHIGLDTNVYPAMSRTMWLREYVGQAWMNHQIKELTEPAAIEKFAKTKADAIAQVKKAEEDKQLAEIQDLLSHNNNL